MGEMTRDARRDLRIEGKRLIRRLEELARYGARDDGGCNRLAFTEADKAGRDVVTGWMRQLGLDVSVDAIGNVVGSRPGLDTGPAVMCGSHIDTVRTGGRYDGNLGVLAGLEVVETLNDCGLTTRRPLSVAFFSNEEGSRVAPDMMGSLVYAGGLSLAEAHEAVSIDGTRVGDDLRKIGYLGIAPSPGPVPHAYVELHIEQGPILEAEGIRIGAVTGVQGISWTEVTVKGQANHAGTTPMIYRHDAGYIAGKAVSFVRTLTEEMGGAQVGTVGSLRLEPNLVNVVAHKAVFTVDLRNIEERLLQEAEGRLDEYLGTIADAEGVEISTRRLARFEPVDFDPRIIQLVENVARGLGNSVRRLPAGAGHDAQMLARVCPAGMIFTPSVRGISHNPEEHTEPADIEMGANVLAQVLLTLTETDVL
ncbi:MAG TPA: Zn-dependent hydrolase [Vicinamibacteria bacterium]|nr:Zn-dependent hydrolase [Vicinamibacteria bacterium]